MNECLYEHSPNLFRGSKLINWTLINFNFYQLLGIRLMSFKTFTKSHPWIPDQARNDKNHSPNHLSFPHCFERESRGLGMKGRPTPGFPIKSFGNGNPVIFLISVAIAIVISFIKAYKVFVHKEPMRQAFLI